MSTEWRDLDRDMVTAARRWRDQIIRTCDVLRAVDLSLGLFATIQEGSEATAADGLFAVAMAAAVLAPESPAADREAVAAAIGLLILEYLPHATERLATCQVPTLMDTWHASRAIDSGPPDDELWRLETVTAKTGLGKSMIYRKLHAGTFPRPRRVGDRAIAWLRSEVVDWMHTLPEARSDASGG